MSIEHKLAIIAFSILLHACNVAVRQTDACQEFGLGNFSYNGKYLDISQKTENARATHWKPDGSVVYVTGRYSNNVAAYQLAEPWEVSTGTFLFDAKLPGEFQHGLFLKPDGERMWVFDRTSIWEFDLFTPWDITTISEGRNTWVGDFVERGHDIDFSPKGDTLFIDDRDAEAVFALRLDIPWDVSAFTLVQTLDISQIQEEVRGVEFICGGRVMILMDTRRAELLEFHLKRPYDIQTAELVNTFDVSEQTLQGRGLSFSADFTSFYVTGRDEEHIFQYDLVKKP